MRAGFAGLLALASAGTSGWVRFSGSRFADSGTCGEHDEPPVPPYKPRNHNTETQRPDLDLTISASSEVPPDRTPTSLHRDRRRYLHGPLAPGRDDRTAALPTAPGAHPRRMNRSWLARRRGRHRWTAAATGRAEAFARQSAAQRHGPTTPTRGHDHTPTKRQALRSITVGVRSALGLSPSSVTSHGARPKAPRRPALGASTRRLPRAATVTQAPGLARQKSPNASAPYRARP